MKKPEPEAPLTKALLRYQVIAAYIALAPARGARRATLEALAARDWPGPDGVPIRVAAETIRAWTRRYRAGGLSGLDDKPRARRGVRILDHALQKLICELKREVPERSVERVIAITEELGHVPKGTLTRSTVHRVLQAHGLSARGKPVADAHDLDRFESKAPNDLWQSDMLAGPMLPDPERPGEFRRAWLYAFIDDHSRLCLYGRFSFKGDLPALELVFRVALQKYGVPRRVYYDNGATYRSHHMRQIVAEVGIEGIAFTKVGRPMGHGKIEAFNRFVTNAFIAEVKASSITTLDMLNEAWVAWVDSKYNQKEHGETGETPHARWHAPGAKLRLVDEGKLRQAFLWREVRTADKAGVLSLHAVRFQVGAKLAGRRVEVRYDPEQLDSVEIWHDGEFRERVEPFRVTEHRRAHTEADPQSTTTDKPAVPVADYLGHLVKQRRERVQGPPARSAVDARREADTRVVALLKDRLDPGAFDEPAVRGWLDRYGPIEVDRIALTLDQMLERGPSDLHPTVYLDAAKDGAR